MHLRRRHLWAWIAGGVVVLLVALYFSLSAIVLHYVNRTLAEGTHGYTGHIGSLRLAIFRGGYHLNDLEIDRVEGGESRPFFSARSVDFTLLWKALLHGQLDGQVEMDQPVLVLIHGKTPQQSQGGEQGDWLQVIRDLTPFNLGQGTVRNGRVRFQMDFGGKPREIDLTRVDIDATNLSNYKDAPGRLIGNVKASALLADQAPVQLGLALDPQAAQPYFDCDLLIDNLKVTDLTPLTRSYANFDFEGGHAQIAAEVAVKHGQVRGYVKPILTHFSIAKFKGDVEQDHDGPLIFTWENVVGLFSFLLEDKSVDRFATIVPITGPADQPHVDIWQAIRNALENAYGDSIKNGLQNDTNLEGGFEESPEAYRDKIAEEVGSAPDERPETPAAANAPGWPSGPATHPAGLKRGGQR